MTLKNNRAPLLCYFKLCASFHSYLWIQTGVTVQKCPNWVKIGYILSCVTFKFGGWPWKTVGHISYATSSLVHHFVTTCEFKPSYGPETAKLGFDLCDLDLWSLTLTFCVDITFVNSNNSWKFHDNTMRGVMDRQTERADGGTDGQSETNIPPYNLVVRAYNDTTFV